jgi:hypothetical protein
VPGAACRDSVARILGDPGMPPSQAKVVAVAIALAHGAEWEPEAAAERARELWVAAQQAVPAGILLDEADPFLLEVHRPVELDDTPGDLPLLLRYVRRAHDDLLARLADRAVEGGSAAAVLVAGSSAGKTRACWEALGPLRAQGGWRLWHPLDPGRQEAALRDLPRVGPRTVIWLNETQEYLAGSDGERLAAGLRAAIADPARARFWCWAPCGASTTTPWPAPLRRCGRCWTTRSPR